MQIGYPFPGNLRDKMKKLIYTATIFFTLCFNRVYAQDTLNRKWTLEDCINYAIENNIGLQRQKLVTENSEANLLKSKMDILPNLNFGTQGQLGFGRSVNPVTNLYTFKQTLSNQYSLYSNLQIFNGFTTMNTISANKFMVKAGLEQEKIARNTLIVDILGQYYQVVYTIGLENASQMQLQSSEEQLFRITKMVETGKEALSKQYEMESQVSADRLTYTVARNNASQALTMLKQLEQIEPRIYFDVEVPEANTMFITDSNYDPDSVYTVASQVLPRLKAIELELQSTQKQVASAKGYISPRISVGGSIFTGYYKTSDELVEQASFSKQLKDNNSQSVNVLLEIPLFNNYTTGRNIKIAKIRKHDASLRLEQEKNNLYTEIENACLDFNRGKDEFTAADDNLEFNKKSYAAVEKKFESGLVDVTNYSVAKTTLFTAETEALRTRLQLYIRKVTVLLYCTGEYEGILTQ
jgi:outer membrane protein